MAVVTPTDRLKKVRNRCLIEVFVGVFALLLCFLAFSVGIRAFVMGLSQISSFFALYNNFKFLPSRKIIDIVHIMIR